MIPGTVALTLRRGDSIAIPVRFRPFNSNGTLGAYPDLTGYTPKAQIRATPGAPDPAIATFGVTLDDQTVSPGAFTLSLTHAQSSAAIFAVTSTAGWDCQVTTPTGDVYTLIAGPVVIEGEYTT